MRTFDISRSVAPNLRTIQDAGMDILATQDFDQVADLWPETGRKQQSPMMRVSRHEFTQSDAFWLFLTEGGEAIGGMGVKFVDLVDEDFDSYIRRTSRDQYERPTDPIIEIARPIREMIGGKVVYFGELEIREGRRGRLPVLSAFVGLAKALAAMQWPGFDWMYAFIPQEHIRFSGAYGFTYQLPRAIEWQDPVPDGRLNSHWIIAMDRHSYAHSLPK